MNEGIRETQKTWWTPSDFRGLSPESILTLKTYFDARTSGGLWSREVALRMLWVYRFRDAREYTYFMRFDTRPGCIKIGWSHDPIARANRMNGYLVAVLPHNQESYFHARFDQLRVVHQGFKGGSEFFRVEDDLLAFLRINERSVPDFFDGIRERHLRRGHLDQVIAGSSFAPELAVRDPWGEAIYWTNPEDGPLPEKPEAKGPVHGERCICDRCMDVAAYLYEEHGRGHYDCRCLICASYEKRLWQRSGEMPK